MKARTASRLMKPVRCLVTCFLRVVVTWHTQQEKIGSSHLVCQVMGVSWLFLTLTEVAPFASSAHVLQLERKNEYMKKTSIKSDEMRAEYSQVDLGPLVRGKYAARYAKATNIVVIDPALTKAFPNNEAVNDALRSLLTVATAATGMTSRSSRTPRKHAAA